jgi:hypothetical protein
VLAMWMSKSQPTPVFSRVYVRHGGSARSLLRLNGRMEHTWMSSERINNKVVWKYRTG